MCLMAAQIASVIEIRSIDPVDLLKAKKAQQHWLVLFHVETK